MQFADSFMSPDSALTWVFGFLVMVVCMYFARIPAHRTILSLTRALHHSLRLAARSALRAEERLTLRNREVLLAHGREQKERFIEREFERIDAGVRRDLSECPSLNRRLSEQVTKMEEDHDQSKEVPPVPPGWVHAVKAVAEIDSKGDPMVAKILEGINTSLIKAQNQARDDYRKATDDRHQCLKDMMPHWRQSNRMLGEIDRKITSLMERTQIIDRHMDDYENIMKNTDRAERELTSSSFVQFFISMLALVIAIGGAMINFNLIARPMAEMVGGNTYIGEFKVADIAALVIILVEISMGLFLMESLRITRLFPVIGALADKMRVRMIWFTLTILTCLATVEAGLAYMREILLQDQLATSALLRSEDVGQGGYEMQFMWITMIAQMGLGFILPFALTLVAIPLETFVNGLRTLLGVSLTAFLRGLAMFLRMLGNLFRYLGVMLVDVYDLVIFLPLWFETQAGRVMARPSGRRAAQP